MFFFLLDPDPALYFKYADPKKITFFIHECARGQGDERVAGPVN